MSLQFGGNWTEEKLRVMRAYFTAYATALSRQPFSVWYVDAFAGSGERIAREGIVDGQGSLFGTETLEVSEVKAGSVRVALAIEPPFDRYVFIDRSKSNIASLQNLRKAHPSRKIDLMAADANQALKQLCNETNWRRTRAAIFIDPFGMQVDFSTLQALAQTKSVDVALLFPTGPLNRMLTADGRMPIEWENRITAHLGDCDWRSVVYQSETYTDLFERAEESSRKSATTDRLRRFAFERLDQIFEYVCDRQLELRNSRGAVLYHLFIICANPSPKAKALSKRLATGAVKIPVLK